jgi:hypothetical protein
MILFVLPIMAALYGVADCSQGTQSGFSDLSHALCYSNCSGIYRQRPSDTPKFLMADVQEITLKELESL